MELYFYIVALSALESLALVVIILYRNSGRLEGWMCATTAFAIAVWLYGLAHYFLPLPDADALLWARITLSGALIIPTLFFHSLCVLASIQQRQKFMLIAAYATTAALVALLWTDLIGLHISKGALYFHHYVGTKQAIYG
jgi:hypothetical protein